MTELDSALAMKVGETLAALGVSPGFLETRKLPIYADAERLALVEIDAAGQNWEEIFRVSAPPGCSEHHTGRAVDIGTPHCKVLDEEFEQTEAFDWLVRFAGKFGFRLSYPRGNSCGYAYEPWHWCFVKDFPSRPGETSAG